MAIAKATISGLTNDIEYGVRVFVEGAYGYQTALEWATARVTPRAGIPLEDLPLETKVNLPFIDDGAYQTILIAMDHAGYPANSVTLWGTAAYQQVVTTYRQLTSALDTALGDFSDRLVCADKIIPTTLTWSTYVPVEQSFRAFLLSNTEMAAKWSDTDRVNGSLIDYFSGTASEAKAKRVRGQVYYERNLGLTNTSNKYYSYVIASDGSAALNGGRAGTDRISCWIVPAINIPKSALVKPTPNADGSYDLL